MPPIIPPMTSGKVSAPRIAPRGSPSVSGTTSVTGTAVPVCACRDGASALSCCATIRLRAEDDGAVDLAGLDEVDGRGAVRGGDDVEGAGRALVEPLRDGRDRGGRAGDGDRQVARLGRHGRPQEGECQDGEYGGKPGTEAEQTTPRGVRLRVHDGSFHKSE